MGCGSPIPAWPCSLRTCSWATVGRYTAKSNQGTNRNKVGDKFWVANLFTVWFGKYKLMREYYLMSSSYVLQTLFRKLPNSNTFQDNSRMLLSLVLQRKKVRHSEVTGYVHAGIWVKEGNRSLESHFQPLAMLPLLPRIGRKSHEVFFIHNTNTDATATYISTVR